MSEVEIVRTLTPLLRRHRWAVAGAVALGSIVAITEGLGIGLLVPLLGGSGDAASLQTILLLLAGLLALRNVLTFAHGALLAALTSRLAHGLRRRVFAHYLVMDQRRLDAAERGALVHLAENQTWETSAAIGTVAGIGTRLCKIVVFAAVLLALSWTRTVCVLAALAAVSMSVRGLGKRARVLSHVEMRAWETMAQRIVETLRAMRTVRAFGREGYEQARFDAASASEARAHERMQILHALVAPIGELLVLIVILGVLGLALRDPAAMPSALAFVLVLQRMHPQVQQLDGGRLSLLAASAPIAAVMGVLREADAHVAPGGRASVPTEGADIVVRNVTFRYAAGEPAALSDVSLTIPRGRTTAIVGPSGSGKSTLVQLLLRTFEPEAGELRVGDTSLRALDPAAWRARIGIVSGDAELFDATVEDNIAYGAPLPVTSDAVRAAATLADAGGFIEGLPQGFATRLGDDGVRLSSGERQRIALARALVRDPAVLVLDDATSAVDPISAEVIERTLAARATERTVILVTHRLAAAERADHVVVLEHGRVREAGRATDLLRQRGGFARLHAAAAGGAAA